MVPVVGAPGIAADHLEQERLAVGQAHMLQGAGAACIDAGANHGLDVLWRNTKLLPKCIHALVQGPVARQDRLNFQQHLVVVFARKRRRDETVNQP
jgi:hypothetical protein